jgi:hypothetical protein
MKDYRGFEIFKKYNWQVKRKQFAVYYGAGNSKATGYFDSIRISELFIDWIVNSDYARVDSETSHKSYLKYQNSLL